MNVSRVNVRSLEKQRLYNLIIKEADHGARALFDSLNEVEKQSVLEMISESMVNSDGHTRTGDVLWEIDYLRKPVGIVEFATDNNYLGATCKQVNDRWMDDLVQVFKRGSATVQWVFTGVHRVWENHDSYVSASI